MNLKSVKSKPIDSTNVLFLPSFKNSQRAYLFTKAECLLYTPSFEHFGIVPLEAMYSRVPVVAVNNGGPTETVSHGQTGYLAENTPESFSLFIADILKKSDLKDGLGSSGRQLVFI